MNKGEITKFAEKILPIYKMLEWKWVGEIPTAKEIEETLINLIISVEQGSLESSTGGLYARLDKEDEGDKGDIIYGFCIEEFLGMETIN